MTGDLAPGSAQLFSEITGYLDERWLETPSRPAGAKPRRRVLLPYTDSVPARRALETVVALFGLVNPEIRVLHLREWIPARGGPLYVETDEDARSILADALDRLGRAGVAATGILGNAATPRLGAEIAAAAARMRATAIVVGSSHRQWLSRLLCGSVSAAVSYQANCPVIVAGPRGETTAIA